MTNAYDVVVGIDPGLTGAIVTYFTPQSELIITDMPTCVIRGKTRIDEDKLLQYLLNEMGFADLCVIELVAAMPGQGVASMASFLRGAGFIAGACRMFALCKDTDPAVRIAPGPPVVEVPAAAWKPAVGLRAAVGARRSERKNASRALATKLFPAYAGQFQRVKDDGRAEAALLAWYGTRCAPAALSS